MQLKLYELNGAQPKSGPLSGNTASVRLTMTTTYLPSNALPPSLRCKFTCGAQVMISAATLPQAGGQYECMPPAVGAPCPNGTLAIASADLPELYTSAVDFQRYISPMSPLYLPYISLHLPTSPYISLYLPELYTVDFQRYASSPTLLLAEAPSPSPKPNPQAQP